MALNPFLFKAQSLPPEIQYKFFLEFSPTTVLELCRSTNPVGPCSNPDFWKEKYQKDFSEFRINLRAQSYRDRYLQIAGIMKPSNWFGHYSDDEINLKSIIQKASQLPGLLQLSELDNMIIEISYEEGRPWSAISESITEQSIVDILKSETIEPRVVNKSRDPILFLMNSKKPQLALNIIKGIGLDRLVTSVDVIYDLLSYIMLGYNAESNESIRINAILNNKELSTLSSLTQSQLRGIYGGNYDHTSLLIRAISGFVVKPLPPGLTINQRRMSFIASLDPKKVWYLYQYYAYKLEKQITGKIDYFQGDWRPYTGGYSPYTFVALQTPHVELENIMVEINEKNSGSILSKIDPSATMRSYDRDLDKIIRIFLHNPKYAMN